MRYSSPQASASPARTWVSTSAISAALISPVAFRRSIYGYAGTLENISLRLQLAAARSGSDRKVTRGRPALQMPSELRSYSSKQNRLGPPEQPEGRAAETALRQA